MRRAGLAKPARQAHRVKVERFDFRDLAQRPVQMNPAATRPDARADADARARVVLDTVRTLAAELHPRSLRMQSLGQSDSLEADFGLDSLARVELVSRLERAVGVRLPERAFAQADTPADLMRWLNAASDEQLLAGEAPAAYVARAAEQELPEGIDTLIEALEWHAGVHPDRVHMLLYGEHELAQPITYAQLRAAALQVAGGLAANYGVVPGDRVAIMLPTGEAFFAAFYGTLYAGAVPVPLYPPARPSQLEDHLRRVAGIVANAGAKVLLTVREARALSSLIKPLAPSLHAIGEVDALRDGPPAPGPQARGAGDVAFLQYTSGSTGQPKGVVLTHANLIANLRGMRDACRANSADLFVSWLPLYHDMGLIGACLGAMCFGFTLALMSPFAFLGRPSRWLWMLHRHRGTITAGPNFAYELCASKVSDEEIRGLDLSSVRLVFNGAEAVSVETVTRFSERFARHGLRLEAMTPVYGLAECSLGLTFPPLGRGVLVDRVDRVELRERGRAVVAAEDARAPVRLLSCGRVLAGHEIRVASPRGEALPERTQGEVQFRGPSATSGYHDNPQATTRLFDGGWLRTGDLGYLADGELFVTGRTKDIIIRGGHNIHPQELEEAAARVAGVRKGGVAVFPAQDPGSGTERLIVLAETSETDARQRERIATEINHLAVDLIGLPADEVVLGPPHSVLKTSSGKIRRGACRERFERGEAAVPVRPPWQQVLRLATAGAAARVRSALARAAALAWGTWACATFLMCAPLAFVATTLSPGRDGCRRTARAGARVLFRLWMTPPRVRGDCSALRGGACVVVPNHSSYLDGFVLTAALPPTIAFVAKRELAPQRFAGTLLRRLGAVFVERFDVERGARDARLIAASLARGERLVVFAEGTFRREPGLLPLHMGAFVSAVSNGVPVVPVAIRGTRRMLPDDDLYPRPARIEVVVGEPITGGGADWQAALRLRAQVRQWLLAQTGEPDLDA
jgi:1-acyl-sn-glycerol-3-phosphate acyltransferase